MPIIKADKMTTDEIKELFLSTNGKIFCVTFTKKDGSERTMTCRIGVKAYLKGGKSTTAHLSHLLTVYSIQDKGYRSVNLDRVVSAKVCGGHYVFNSTLLSEES